MSIPSLPWSRIAIAVAALLVIYYVGMGNGRPSSGGTIVTSGKQSSAMVAPSAGAPKLAAAAPQTKDEPRKSDAAKIDAGKNPALAAAAAGAAAAEAGKYAAAPIQSAPAKSAPPESVAQDARAHPTKVVETKLAQARPDPLSKTLVERLRERRETEEAEPLPLAKSTCEIHSVMTAADIARCRQP